MKIVLQRIWRLTHLCINGPGGKLGILYCITVLVLNLAGIQITLKLITWNKNFYTALEKYDAHAAIWQIGIFALLTGLSASQYLIATYIRKLLQIRWRTTLTHASLDRWMKNKAYWHLNTTESSLLDNPDQRISEDCRLFVERLTGEALDLISGIVGLTTYAALLWQLSSFPLQLTLFNTTVVIYHYMVFAAPLYVLLCSGLTHWLGAPLMKLNVTQQHREADMRFALTRFRESREAIALESGEEAERNIMNHRFNRIVENWRKLIKRDFILGCFTRPYLSTVLRIPVFLALPAYLAGHVALGGLMQLGSAFQNLVTTLSWFIFSYRNLAELAATSHRLDYFLTQAEDVARNEPSITCEPSPDNLLCIHNLNIKDPHGKTLINLPELTVKPGEAVWIDGPSGMGKSTLLKAISGLWPHCHGTIDVPEGKQLFMPQKAYLPLGNLAASVTYPKKPDDMEAIKTLLTRVGLTCPRHAQQLDSITDMASDYNLSGGELQRLMIARILSAAPDWVFLDEATSALDAIAEQQLYSLLRESLPNAGFIIISHREPRGLGTFTHIDLRTHSISKQEAKDHPHFIAAVV